MKLATIERSLGKLYNKKSNNSMKCSWTLPLDAVKLIDWPYESFGRTCRTEHISGTISKGSFNAAILFYGPRKVNKMENNLCFAYRSLSWKTLLNTPYQAFVEDRHLHSALGS